MNPEDYSPVASTSVKLVSLTGQLIQYLRNTDDTGEILKCTVEQLKNGGVNTIVFSVDRRTNIPVFPGLIIEVYKDAELFATGYSDTVPQPQSDNPELEVKCLGFMHKLKLLTVTKTYNSVTLSEIIEDLEPEFNQVDIFYDAGKIDLPATTVTDLRFEDKSLFEVIQTINQIANEDWETAQYRWFIDNERTINFAEIPQEADRGIFEGFNYQNPTVEDDDSKIINRVLLWRTSSADSKETEYITTLNDTDSQGKYGIRDKKITFPDFMDTTTINKFGNAVLQRFKDPKTRVGIDDLEGIDFPFSFYKLTDRFDEYWQLMSECDDFDNWDLSNVDDTSVELSTEQVLTGRRSIKCTTDVGSLNEYIQLNLPTPIFGPNLFRFYLFLEEQMNIEIELIGENGETFTFSLGTTDFNLDVNETVSIVKHLELNPTAGSSDYGAANIGDDNYGG